ncbi:MAG: hypothetical protein AB7U20_23980 [Planctomycetaceae bacterium]
MAYSVAELCLQRGFTVAQLADRSGLAADRTTAIVLGRWTPSPSERSQVAAALGVLVAEISWGHTTPIQHLYGQGPA